MLTNRSELYNNDIDKHKDNYIDTLKDKHKDTFKDEHKDTFKDKEQCMEFSDANKQV